MKFNCIVRTRSTVEIVELATVKQLTQALQEASWFLRQASKGNPSSRIRVPNAFDGSGVRACKALCCRAIRVGWLVVSVSMFSIGDVKYE